MSETVQAKVDRVVEELEAEGADVTARAVRERAGVRMSVAAEAAKAWNERQAAAAEIPDVPATVQNRLDGIWREAVQFARAELSAEREGLRQQVEAAHEETEAYRAEVKALEDTRDDLDAELTQLRDQAAIAADSAREELASIRSRADRAEAKLEAVENERDRLLAERDSLRQERDQLLAHSEVTENGTSSSKS